MPDWEPWWGGDRRDEGQGLTSCTFDVHVAFDVYVCVCVYAYVRVRVTL